MSEFKVGDKVCDPIADRNGIVAKIREGDYYYPVVVHFDDGEREEYTGRGLLLRSDRNKRLFIGHMEHGTGAVTFTTKKEPVYEWQWLLKSADTISFSVSCFKRSLEEIKFYERNGWIIQYRIEESKREVKP